MSNVIKMFEYKELGSPTLPIEVMVEKLNKFGAVNIFQPDTKTCYVTLLCNGMVVAYVMGSDIRHAISVLYNSINKESSC